MSRPSIIIFIYEKRPSRSMPSRNLSNCVAERIQDISKFCTGRLSKVEVKMGTFPC